ncbi:2-nitropropane dioxygenase [Ramaria rubella]|nr:2-nitropropane dioxygenase [Ramaria rubella]
MARIQTALTTLLDIHSPVVVPPMTFASGGKLAGEVTKAGGFGFAAPGFQDPATFARELDVVRNILSLGPDIPLPIGVGAICWLLDAKPELVATLDAALEHRVKSIWLSFGNDLGKWVAHVRQFDQNRKVPHKTLVWVLVNSVAEAERAANEWKADIIIVQGIEAGGHGHGQALPLLTLFPLVKSALPNGPPLVAAGGLSNGAHIAALLTLGADGCVIGTRYLATPESTYTDNQKAAVLGADLTVRSVLFDELSGLLAWPKGVDGRAIANKLLEDEAKGIPLEERKKLYMEAVKNNDTSRTAVWAGVSVALVNEITAAGTLTRTIHQEIITHIKQASALIKAV